MNESLEQRALRIKMEVDKLPGLVICDATTGHTVQRGNKWYEEYARRLTAEQGEPVRWLIHDLKMPTVGMIMVNDRDKLKHYADKNEWRIEPLYASPPSDALDAKRLDYVLTHIDEVATWGSFETKELCYAAIDAAMEKAMSDTPRTDAHKAFIDCFGDGANWLSRDGSYFTEGYNAGKAELAALEQKRQEDVRKCASIVYGYLNADDKNATDAIRAAFPEIFNES